jgi:hypothetical protein
VIYIAPTTIGEIIGEGHRFAVKRLPSGNFRVEKRAEPETGANFVWQNEDWFRRFYGAPKSAEETDAECERLLQRCPRSVQAVMFG